MDSPNPIRKYDRKPCGCVVTEFEDGRKQYAPCIPCGLMRAGYALAQAGSCWPWQRRRALLEAGNALAAVATTINAQAARMKPVAKVNKAIEDILNKEDEE